MRACRNPSPGGDLDDSKYGDEMRRQASRVFLMLKSLGLIFAICCATAAFAQNRYQVTRIPTPQGANSAALGINNRGESSVTVFKQEIIKHSFIPLRINL